ncbi:hypothetical protein B0T10DRAFT_93256 [Thelonectria olida]|uniref:Glucose-repressible alcohol dehydrogenase transcriptional effector n=1 Tax=Thelonectria olida TaxID=1576542 RepID=A0A9P8VZA6_9HYPO|nr:hypothetical protein B0T10DRAFT_93256 [Thelonectria olida]
MSEEPTLPPLPGVSWNEQSQSFSNNPRKRVRHPHSTNNAPILKYNSSDPAIFSSDDDPALDNYVEGRRKKRYVGSWFQQHPTSSDSTFSETLHIPKQRRPWTRQADSGVFLGSDGDDSDDVMEGLELSPPKPRLPLVHRSPLRRVSKAEHLARDKVRACLDQGQETVDFWSMGLEDISNDTIGLLSQFSCIPVVAKDVAFVQKDPELKIYLAMNRLTRVPGTIFDLTYLTILSLRGNKLTELPPAISKLHNLQELNVSQNRLRHLPVELLDLFTNGNNLHTLAVHPNPFWQPEHGSEDEVLIETKANPANMIVFNYGEVEEPLPIPHLVSKSLGRSPAQLSNTTGRVFSDFQFPSDYRCRILPVETDADESSDDNLTRATSVPSLLEVALRTCYRSAQLPEMSGYMPDGLPNLRRLLERAAKQKETGGLSCSRCRKSIVVPTAEWVEWREIRTCKRSPTLSPLVSARVVPLSMADGESAVPFIHRGCSWRCRPAEVGEGAWAVPKGFPDPLLIEEGGK